MYIWDYPSIYMYINDRYTLLFEASVSLNVVFRHMYDKYSLYLILEI